MEPAPQPTRSSFSAGNLLVSLGGLLIVIGILVLIFASWQSFTPAGRIITVTLPLALLYLISFFSWRQPQFKRYAHYILLTASIILPFVVGVILYQSGLYTEVNSTLVLYCSLLSLPVYVLTEVVVRQEEQALFVIIAMAVAAITYCLSIEAKLHGYALAAIIIGAIQMVAGFMLRGAGTDEEKHTYSMVGFCLFWAGIVLWPILFYMDKLAADNVFTKDPSVLWLSLGSAVSGLVLFTCAAFYGTLWLRNKENRTFLQIRQIAEHSAPLMFVIPAALVALSERDAQHALIALLLSVVTIVVSHFVRVSTFRTVGYAALGITLARLIFMALSQLSAFWPILLLVGGFLLIALAYILTHLESRSLATWLWKQPAASLFGLGEYPAPPPPAADSTLNSIAPAPPVHSSDTGWQWLILLIIVLLIFAFL